MIELQESNKNSNPLSNKEKELKEQLTEKNYYANYIEQIGFTKAAWIIFVLASFLQFIWGQETCFVSINIANLGQARLIPVKTISFSVCLLYSMMGVGSALVGTMTHSLDRIPVLFITLIIHIVTTVISSFSTSFAFIVALHCLNNIAISIFNIISLNLMTELFPTRNRSLILMINSGFYNVGNLYTILVNYFFGISSEGPFSTFKWRLANPIFAIAGIISVILLAIYGTESPLYLFSKKKFEQGFEVLESITHQALDEEQKQKIIQSITSRKNYQLKSSYLELFMNDYWVLTLSSLIICSICYLNMIGISYLIPQTLEYLHSPYKGSQLLIYAIIQLPNGFIGGFMTESEIFGRKKTIWISALVCGIFYFISAFWMKHAAIYAGMIMLFNSICFGAGFIYVSEVFPTNLRDVAQSFIQCFSFLLGSWSPFLVDALPGFWKSYLFLGGSNLVCMIVAFFLPVDTFLRPLDEDI